MTLDLEPIKARREAATRLSDPCDHRGCHSHLTHPCEGCGRQGGFASWESLLNMTRTDFPACITEIERLQGMEIAFRDLYNDCRNEPCDEQRGKVMDKAFEILEQE